MSLGNAWAPWLHTHLLHTWDCAFKVMQRKFMSCVRILQTPAPVILAVIFLLNVLTMPHLKGHKFSCLLFIHFVIWNFFTIMYGVSLYSTVNVGTSWNFWWYSFYNAYLAQVFQMNTVCSTENIANAHYNNLLLAIHKTWLSVSCFSIITWRSFQLSCLQELTDCIFQCSRRW